MPDLAPNIQKMKINKTESEYNMKSIRFLLLTITAMFMFIACLMIVLGISVYGTYHNFNFFYNSVKSGHFITPSVLCVFTGLILMVVSLFGFCGSLKRSTCMVNVYAVFLVIIFIFKLVVVILAFTLSHETIDQFLDLPVTDYTTDPEIQDEIDALQSSLGCCGSNSFMDYIGLEFNSNHQTAVISKENEHGDQITVIVPSSCCTSHGEVFCTRMWGRGCKQALSELLLQNATVIGVLGISVMFVNLLGIIFALLLARCIRKMKSERALMLWKIKEQFILAKEAEEAAKTPDVVQPPAPDHVYIQQQDSSVA